MAVAASGMFAQSVAGRVLDAHSGTALPGAVVSLVDGTGVAVDLAVSDSTGAFILVAPGPGDYFVEGRYFGGAAYRDGPVTLVLHQKLEVEFALPPTPIGIEGLEIEVERQLRRLRQIGFYDRERWTGGVHMDVEDLSRRPATTVRDLLRPIPGVLVPNSSEPGAGYILFGAAERSTIQAPEDVDGIPTVCAPRVFLDGYLLQPGGPTSFRDILDPNDVVHPSDLIGIEIYRTPAEVPVQYGGAQSMCGVLLMWTRTGGGLL